MKRVYTFIFILLCGFGLQGQVSSSQDPTSQEVPVDRYNDDQRLMIPTAFTPNGDGINDIYFIDAKNFTEIEFNIFDRYGNLVYNANNASFKWDGSVNGKRIRSDIYVFIFTGKTSLGTDVKKSGTISVIF